MNHGYTIILLHVLTISCTKRDPCTNPYTCASAEQRATWKKMALPFAGKHPTKILQGPFGKDSHAEPGNEYAWDFALPYGSEVLAAEAGTVIDVYQPQKGGDCNPEFSNVAHNLKIEHADGTVAQYVHIETILQSGTKVEQGK